MVDPNFRIISRSTKIRNEIVNRARELNANMYRICHDLGINYDSYKKYINYKPTKKFYIKEGDIINICEKLGLEIRITLIKKSKRELERPEFTNNLPKKDGTK